MVVGGHRNYHLSPVAAVRPEPGDGLITAVMAASARHP